ncbi:MAG TPA: transcriptional repressor, partial [Candidatus Marinimicrobia bacterium]|nr:transcriptional repressor [Candidatus Neomarinimicrobiota bacterium]
MRYSRQRETILQTVKVMDLHPSADDVYSRVRKRMPQISLGTIYRNLNQLVGMGE